MVPMIPCSKSHDGRHNFPPGGDCINGCGTNQSVISGRVKKIDVPLISRFKMPKAEKAKGIHSALHQFVAELRQEFGETAKSGVGSFSYYLGYIKRIGLQDAYRIHAEIRQSVGKVPKRLFWWKIGDELKKRREKKNAPV